MTTSAELVVLHAAKTSNKSIPAPPGAQRGPAPCAPRRDCRQEYVVIYVGDRHPAKVSDVCDTLEDAQLMSDWLAVYSDLPRDAFLVLMTHR